MLVNIYISDAETSQKTHRSKQRYDHNLANRVGHKTRSMEVSSLLLCMQLGTISRSK